MIQENDIKKLKRDVGFYLALSTDLKNQHILDRMNRLINGLRAELK